ncbi:DUF742 domain-containing protein [Streptomyces zhihengii]
MALRQDFVEAVADICSASEAGRQQLLDAVSAVRVQSRTPASPDATVSESRLVLVQQRSLEVSDRLLRALERQQQLERERNDANQMVLILLAMVDKLQRDVTTLNREHDRLRASVPDENAQRVFERLAKSEQQRETAEAELDRAKAERQKADQLAEEATEQVRLLTEQLERLRGGVPGDEGIEPIETAVPVMRTPLDAELDDIDLALSKAASHLDDRADRLDQLASELHSDIPVDIPSTSASVPDNLQTTEPVPVLAITEQVVEHVHALLDDDTSGSTAMIVLHKAGEELPVQEVLRAAVLIRATSTFDPKRLLLRKAVDRTEVRDVPGLVRSLRAAGQDAELYQFVNETARLWPAHDLVTVVAALRSDDQDADAYRVLSAVGRQSRAAEVFKVLQALNLQDSDWVLSAAGDGRTLEELPARGGSAPAAPLEAGRLADVYMRRKVLAERRNALVPRPAPASLLASDYTDDEQDDSEDPFHVRPYAMVGGDGRRPRYKLADHVVVRTTTTADLVRSLLPEHQRICSLCQVPHDIRSISQRLRIPIGVVRILVSDLAAEGFVALDTPSAASNAGDVGPTAGSPSE